MAAAGAPNDARDFGDGLRSFGPHLCLRGPALRRGRDWRKAEVIDLIDALPAHTVAAVEFGVI
jgi:hypothetical protein